MTSAPVQLRRKPQQELFPPKIRLDPKKLFRQRQILARCKKHEIDLEDELKSIGWTYEDLQYESYEGATPFDESATCHLLHETAGPTASVPTVSFFSGAGGMDLGFEAAGFSHVALIEHDELFCSTLRLNRPDWTVIGPPLHAGDVSRRQAVRAALQRLGVRRSFDGIFLGGPPCQPFSIAANQRFRKSGKGFKRIGFEHHANGNLLFDYIGQIKTFLPRVFVIENVTGLMDIDGGEQLAKGIAELSKVGYTIHAPLVLNAAHFGVPQNRRRLFIVGWRVPGRLQLPMTAAALVPSFAALISLPSDLTCHVTRIHEAASIDRYAKLRYGERDPLGRVDRLDPGLPSKTIIAGGSKGGGRSHLHPMVPRTLSVRESARLQSFPDDYEFFGSPARQFTQVGNAVPPVLARSLASAIQASFF